MSGRRYTEEQFRAAVESREVRTMADLCRALGRVPGAATTRPSGGTQPVSASNCHR